MQWISLGLNIFPTSFFFLNKGLAIKHVFKNLEWLNSWTCGNLMASSLDIFRDADYSVFNFNEMLTYK
ncbi:hypothetical protein RhiirA1_483907 [Rhizophagus irregularis]|uniref:Uncharacterized protein n=1 Tax=Rhizophagus irregularis TaxID=588596 RepID=A0A2N0QJZ2_9GLOM|nr:hypothetical protein RhiirA1_483907 [Rhizophagus irregularis]